jgi:NADP-dependent 3-hydroxy acid dehydrogenase YdfG
MKRLDGKVAVIAGGAGSIGQATGRLFAAEGVRVLLVDRAEEALQPAVQAIGRRPSPPAARAATAPAASPCLTVAAPPDVDRPDQS